MPRRNETTSDLAARKKSARLAVSESVDFALVTNSLERAVVSQIDTDWRARLSVRFNGSTGGVDISIQPNAQTRLDESRSRFNRHQHLLQLALGSLDCNHG